MRLSTSLQKLAVFLLITLLSLPLSVSGKADKSIPDLLLSPGDHPAAETIFVPNIDEIPRAEPDPAWYVRTGAKKGLSGNADTDEELFAAPDTAILARGFSAPWQAIMAGYQEPVVPVRHDETAGLGNTKPLLIIPSGALSGTSGSSFFKAGLTEYAGSGGIIFCLAQRNGADFSALPVPEGQRLEAAGWSQDAGPLFRTATVRVGHPLLADITEPAPLIETDGYFAAWPAGAQVLLARPDGYATMVFYPVGKGWVVATTLFTDFSSLLGSIHPDEKILIRNLLAWAKEPGKRAGISPQNAPSSGEDRSSTRPVPSAVQAETIQAARPDARLVVRATADRKGDLLKLSLEIPPQAGLVNQPLLVRTEEQEKPVMVSKNKAVLSFDIPVRGRTGRISYAVYGTNGRAVARGSVAVPHPGESHAAPDHPYYLPGDAAAVRFAGVGKGEITLLGMGFLNNMIIADRGSMNLPVPRDLPAGTYRMHWNFEGMRRERKEGDFTIDLCGYRVAFETVLLERKPEGKRFAATVQFRIRAAQKMSGRLSVLLRSPGGKTVNAADAVLSLVDGVQTVPVTFPFAPERGGLWELVYTLSATLPDAAGIPSNPAPVAAGSLLFDVGGIAVLAVVPGKSFYYEPSGPVEGTAIIAGKGRAAIEVELDDKQTSREQLELTGISRYRFSLPQPDAGGHTVSISVADDSVTSSKQRVLTYGLRLPDLTMAIAPAEPKPGGLGPVMPVTMLVRNEGKTAAGASRARLYDNPPSKGGKLITTVDVPELGPRGQRKAVFDWPLYAKAGARTLHALADAEDAVKESNKSNNTAAADIVVPDILLAVNSGKTGFRAVDPVSFPVSVFNLTTRSLKALALDMYIEDRQGGKKMSSGKMAIDELPAKSKKTFRPSFTLASPPAGAYRFSAGLAGGTEPAVTADFQILPTLLLTGTLEGTPATAVLCKPFSVKYKIKNAGNVPPSSGTVRLEIIPSVPGQPPVYSKQIPLFVGERSIPIDAVLSRGTYTARLTASAVNAEGGLTVEFKLAEQLLTVSGVIDVRRVNTSFPRVLLWLGRQGRMVEQAVSETIVKQAFSQEDLYFAIVDSGEDFAAQAMTGRFNTYVLFEPQEMPGKTEWLKERLGQGQGVVIIGSGEIARAVAEDFGFTFDDAPSKKDGEVLTFTGDAGLGLSGNLRVSGKILYPRKRGAKPGAVYSSSGRAAALMDAPKGRIMVMPLSLSRSALNGPTALYSLVLRKAALFVAPETDEARGQAPGQLSISSPDPVNARIREVLPAGSRVLWTNAQGSTEKNIITYELKADKEPAKLLYLYQPPIMEKTAPVAEIFFECGGKLVSQEKIE